MSELIWTREREEERECDEKECSYAHHTNTKTIDLIKEDQTLIKPSASIIGINILRRWALFARSSSRAHFCSPISISNEECFTWSRLTLPPKINKNQIANLITKLWHMEKKDKKIETEEAATSNLNSRWIYKSKKWTAEKHIKFLIDFVTRSVNPGNGCERRVCRTS